MNSNYISGQYLFGEKRDRTEGGRGSGLDKVGVCFLLYLAAWQG